MELDKYQIDPVEGSATLEGDIDIANDDDFTLAKKIQMRIADGEAEHKQVVDEAEQNVKMLLGEYDDLGGADMTRFKSTTILNRMFLTIRNLKSAMMEVRPQVEVDAGKDTPKSREKADKVKGALDYGVYRTLFPEKIGECYLDTMTKRDSFIYWFWNYKINDFDFEPVPLEELTFSPDATTVQDAEYVIYHPLKNRSWWKEHYPEQYDNIKFEKKAVGNSILKEEKTTTRGTVARLWNYWENDKTISMVKGKEGEWIVLEKKENPNYEFRTIDDQIRDWANEARPEETSVAQEAGLDIKEVLSEEDVLGFTPIINYLNEPRKPFIQIPSVKRMKELYSIDLVKQARPVLISYNMKKRRIEDILRGCGIKMVIDEDSIGEKEQEKITDEPFQLISAAFNNSGRPFYYEGSIEVPQSLYQDIAHDENYLDDLFAEHEVSRGSAQANTLGQDQMNRAMDQKPVKTQIILMERAIKEMFEGWIQLMKMYYTETHYVKKFGSEEGTAMMEIINEEIEEGIEPRIIEGTMMPVDKEKKKMEAMELWSQQAIDPYSLYEAFEYPDARELSNRLVNWMQFGIISDEDPGAVGGDSAGNTEDPIERADQENKAVQSGKEIPPTPPEMVSKEHIQLHIDFAKDPKIKMEDDDKDLLLAHAETDKATFTSMIVEQASREAQIISNQEGNAVSKQETAKVDVGKQAGSGQKVEKERPRQGGEK